MTLWDFEFCIINSVWFRPASCGEMLPSRLNIMMLAIGGLYSILLAFI